jgi:hypothetical protein
MTPYRSRAAVDHLFREGRLLLWGIPATGVLVETAIERLAAAPADEGPPLARPVGNLGAHHVNCSGGIGSGRVFSFVVMSRHSP